MLTSFGSFVIGGFVSTSIVSVSERTSPSVNDSTWLRNNKLAVLGYKRKSTEDNLSHSQHCRIRLSLIVACDNAQPILFDTYRKLQEALPTTCIHLASRQSYLYSWLSFYIYSRIFSHRTMTKTHTGVGRTMVVGADMRTTITEVMVAAMTDTRLTRLSTRNTQWTLTP